jgi:hypothetical protein
MKIKFPSLKRTKTSEAKSKKHEPEKDLTVNTAGAMTVAVTFFLFPEPVVTTTVGFFVALTTGAYYYYKAKKSRMRPHKKDEAAVSNTELYLELIKIKMGVYAILVAMFIWVVSVISAKIVGAFFEAIDLLPTYIRALWALAFGVLIFVWLISFKSTEMNATYFKKTPNKGVERDAG